MPASKGKNYNQISTKEKEQIVSEYYGGKNIPDLVKQFDTTKRTVPKILQEFDVYTARRGRYKLNESYFEVVDSEEKAYWLGLIAADGCVTKTNYFAISLKDREILEQLKLALDFSGGVYTPKSKQGVYYRINFSSKQLCDDLRKYGIVENKTFLFNSLPDIRHGLIRHFIRGYFDGDGTISSSITTTYNPRKTCFSNSYQANIIATEQFCRVLQNELFSEIGYKGYITKSKSTGMDYLRIYKKKALKDFFWYMYHNAELYIQRKHDKWQEFLGSLDAKSSKEKQGEPVIGV